MINHLMASAQRLAEALHAENEALALLDMPRAATLAAQKQEASERFAAAYAAAQRSTLRLEGRLREHTEQLAGRLRDLGAENRRLLERAIDLQSRVIETIAGAARPGRAATYGARGHQRDARAVPLSFSSRA